MSDPWGPPWSDNPNAPKISHTIYFDEKVWFVGNSLSSILYGAPQTPPLTRPSLCAHFVYLVYSRDSHRCVPTMYSRAAQYRPSQRETYQVGTHILHHGYVLGCDHRNCDAV